MAVFLRLGATLGSAGLYGLCFPTAGLRWLAWGALVPFLVALRRATTPGAVGLACVWTLAATYAVADFLPRSVATYYQQSMLVGCLFFAGVAVLAAPYLVVFALCYRALARRASPALALLAGAAWATVEWGRSTFLTGNPWAVLGYSQVGVGPVVQVADVTGVYGLSFVLVTVNAALTEAWLAARSGVPRRAVGSDLLGAAAVLGIVLGYGVVRLAVAPPPAAPSTPTKVGIVQGNLDLGSQWRQEFYGRNLDAYAELTREVLRQERPAVVFWPESAMTFFLDQEPLYRSAVAAVLAPYGSELITGAPRFAGSREAPRYYNTAFLLSPAGEITEWYDKHHLLPFAEYFPLGSIDFLRRRFARVREFVPGVSDALLPTVAGLAGVIICNEAVFPDMAAARVRAGAAYLVNLANDSWVSDPKFSAQLFDMVSLRAVEQRRYLVRASTSAFSAIVDPWGRTTAVAAPFTRAWIVGAIEGASGVTVYGRVGDLFVLLCAIAVGGALLRGGTTCG